MDPKYGYTRFAGISRHQLGHTQITHDYDSLLRSMSRYTHNLFIKNKCKFMTLSHVTFTSLTQLRAANL